MDAARPVLSLACCSANQEWIKMEVQSAMSVGAWTLAAFSSLSGAAAFANFVNKTV